MVWATFGPKSQCEHRTALALCAIYRYIIGSLLSDKINYLPLWARMVRLSLCENIIARINIPNGAYIDGTHAYRNAKHRIRKRESTMECDRCNKFARRNIGADSGPEQNVKCNKWHTWHAGCVWMVVGTRTNEVSVSPILSPCGFCDANAPLANASGKMQFEMGLRPFR